MADRKKKDGVGTEPPPGELDASAHASSGAGSASGFPVDEAGEPLPGHPHYFSIVAWEPQGRMDFVLRHLLRSEE